MELTSATECLENRSVLALAIGEYIGLEHVRAGLLT